MAKAPPHLPRAPALVSPQDDPDLPQFHRQRRLTDPPRLVRGELAMTPREFDVLRQVLQEKTIRQMAETLHLKPATIRSYLHSVFRKTRTSTRTTLVAWCQHHGEEHIKQGAGQNGEDLGDHEL